jgi:hypothetical protein
MPEVATDAKECVKSAVAVGEGLVSASKDIVRGSAHSERAIRRILSWRKLMWISTYYVLGGTVGMMHANSRCHRSHCVVQGKLTNLPTLKMIWTNKHNTYEG